MVQIIVAILCLTSASAKSGDGKAEFKKGYSLIEPYLKKSKAMNKDLWKKAIPFFESSCDRNFAAGCLLLGGLIADLGQIETAAKSFQKACSLGHKESCSSARNMAMKSLNNKSASGKELTDAEKTKLCNWWATNPDIGGIFTSCPEEIHDIRRKTMEKKYEKIHAQEATAEQEAEKRKKVLLEKYRKKYKKVVELTPASGIFELNQILGDWVLFIAKGQKHQIAVRRKTLQRQLSRGMMIHRLTPFLGLIEEAEMTNSLGFPVKVFRYDALGY